MPENSARAALRTNALTVYVRAETNEEVRPMKILCATNPSEAANRAAVAAARLAASTRGTLHLLHVANLPLGVGGPAASAEAVLERRRKLLSELAHQLNDDVRGSTSTEVLEGAPDETIAEHARCACASGSIVRSLHVKRWPGPSALHASALSTSLSVTFTRQLMRACIKDSRKSRMPRTMRSRRVRCLRRGARADRDRRAQASAARETHGRLGTRCTPPDRLGRRRARRVARPVALAPSCELPSRPASDRNPAVE
jgi:hypothetical protein